MAQSDCDRVVRLLAGLGLPTDTSPWSEGGAEAWRKPVFQDKKVVRGKIRYILPVGIGAVKEVAWGPEELLPRLSRAAACGAGGTT